MTLQRVPPLAARPLQPLLQPTPAASTSQQRPTVPSRPLPRHHLHRKPPRSLRPHNMSLSFRKSPLFVVFLCSGQGGGPVLAPSQTLFCAQPFLQSFSWPETDTSAGETSRNSKGCFSEDSRRSMAAEPPLRDRVQHRFRKIAALSALIGRSLLARRKQLSGSVPSQKKANSPVPRRILKHKTSIPTRPETQDNKPCHEWKERAAAPRAAASLAC